MRPSCKQLKQHMVAIYLMRQHFDIWGQRISEGDSVLGEFFWGHKLNEFLHWSCPVHACAELYNCALYGLHNFHEVVAISLFRKDFNKFLGEVVSKGVCHQGLEGFDRGIENNFLHFLVICVKKFLEEATAALVSGEKTWVVGNQLDYFGPRKKLGSFQGFVGRGKAVLFGNLRNRESRVFFPGLVW